MKQKKTIIAIMIIIFAFISGCKPVVETAEEPTETPTVVAPTSTVTRTLMPTETQQPTVTMTPEATPTPEVIAEPVIPLPELIQNLDEREKQEVLDILAEQFPLNKENNSYHFFCVGGEIITHKPEIQLPTGQEISHTIFCQFPDLEGQQVGVHIPVLSYSRENLDYKIIGYRTNSSPKTGEELELVVDHSKKGFSNEENATGKLSGTVMTKLSWSGPGHVIFLDFAMPTSETAFSSWSENAYYNEAIQALMSETQIEEFAQTGNPAVLPQTADGEPLLLPVNISLDNVFGSSQYENRYYDFD